MSRRDKAGTKASMARASISPAPSELASATDPVRTAWMRPGTPIFEKAFSSNGSAKPESRRRRRTSMRLGPSIVRT